VLVSRGETECVDVGSIARQIQKLLVPLVSGKG
jgi:hypothetical protein